jgi:hypothetical protein
MQILKEQWYQMALNNDQPILHGLVLKFGWTKGGQKV